MIKLTVLLFLVKVSCDIYSHDDIYVLANRISNIPSHSSTLKTIVNSLVLLSEFMQEYDHHIEETKKIEKEYQSSLVELKNKTKIKEEIEKFIRENSVIEQFKKVEKLKKKLEDRKYDEQKAEIEIASVKNQKIREIESLKEQIETFKSQKLEFEIKIKKTQDCTDKLDRVYDELNSSMKNFENELANKNILIIKTMELEDTKNKFFNKVKEYEEQSDQIISIRKSIENLEKEISNRKDKVIELNSQSSKYTESKKNFDVAFSMAKELEDIKTFYEKILELNDQIVKEKEKLEEQNKRVSVLNKQTEILQREGKRTLKEVEVFENEIKNLPEYLKVLEVREKETAVKLEKLKGHCSDLEQEINKIEKYSRISNYSLITTVLASVISFSILGILQFVGG